MNKLDKNSPKLVIDFEHDDMDKQEHLLIHIANLLRDFGDKPLVIEVVAYGPGIMLLVKARTKFLKIIEELSEQSVDFHVCRNAMNKFGIQETDLVPVAASVSSGVGRIVTAQIEGAVYLKA